MRAVVQRVKKARVRVEGKIVGEIANGILVYLGVEKDDNESDITYLSDKILNLRIFEDDDGKMNRSLMDIAGEILIVSQFTLYGDCRKGRRPSFSQAGAQDMANSFYQKFIDTIKKTGTPTQAGTFQAHMEVESLNDGPVTLLLDSSRLF